MPLKRTLNSPTTQTPRRGPKRRHLCSSLPPSSPCPSSSSLATPRTPAWTVPADSPTNPFGRIRRLTHGTTLPPPTSYSKHLPLRFQFIHPRADGRDSKRDGVYRVVQVPLNYTLAHLRKLLIYVFDPAKDNEITVPYNLRRPLNRLSRTLSSDRGKGKELATPSDLIGHLFEVQKRVEIGQDGVIKQGHTWVKSSTTRDPYHYPGNDLQDTLFLDDESDQWRWEAEEDVQLVKVWPKGGDLARAIIYHHDAHTQIHITVNTMKIPPRKGVGNTPFLFLAYGSLSLSNPDGTLRLGTVETTRWNRIGAYDRFLKNEADNDRAANQADDDDSDEDAEGEVDPDVSSATLPIYGLDSSPFVASDSSNPVTPFPAEPSLRRRVDYENRRILKLTKASMKDAGLSDEEDDVDELANDDVDPAWKEKPSDWDPFQDGDEIC
ncbi:hypothetical protein J3A83DRAFT_4370862 [Scleroderma citrinum]